MSAVAPERVDDAGAPPGDMSGIVLAPEMTMGVTSPQRVSPKRTSCPHVTTASPVVLTMVMTLATRVMAQVTNVSTSIFEITTKATTSVCQRLTILLGPHLALTSRGS